MSSVQSSYESFGLDVDINTNRGRREASISIYPAPDFEQYIVRTELCGPFTLSFNKENDLVQIEITDWEWKKL